MALETARDANVGMGQIVLARGEVCLRAVLGSCIGVALHHPRHRVGVLAHVVLPDSSGRPSMPGKYADTAVPYMLGLLAKEGIHAAGLVAKIAGGAAMFGHSGPLQIGDANCQAVVQSLDRAGIRINGRDTGDTKGRRVTLNCSSGQLVVESVGQPTRVL